ncbi:MAG: helix-turn-helix domain-containing protein [Geminicoccaceae bacterium]
MPSHIVRAKATNTDRHVSVRINDRRIILGITLQQMADILGCAYQQAHKYCKGTNRISAGRLYQIGGILGVEVDYFFEGIDDKEYLRPTPSQRMMLDLARNFIGIPTQKHQEALCDFARGLSDG